MTDQTNTPEPTLRSGTSPLLIVLALTAGFLMGVAFSAWKLKTPDHTVVPSQNTSKLAKMAEALEAQVARDPENADLLARLGNTYFDTDQYEKAIDAYKRSLAINPKNTSVLTDLGIMYRKNNQPREAVAAFDATIALDPSHENARLNKGIVLMYDFKLAEEAIETWEELREINPLAMVGSQSIDEFIAHFKEGHE